MINIAQLKVGDAVHYQPAHFAKDEYENGIVKEIPDQSSDICRGSGRVVYNCAGDWENYMDYTSALTSGQDLFAGWRHD